MQLCNHGVIDALGRFARHERIVRVARGDSRVRLLLVKNTIFKSRMDYYCSLIYSAESDSKTLFRTITRLLHRKADRLFPTSSFAVDLANKFVHFFEEKIVYIRSYLGSPVIPDFFRTLDTSSLTNYPEDCPFVTGPVIFRLFWKLLLYLHYLRKPT